MLVAHLVVRCHSWSAEGGGYTAWRGHISVKEGDSFCLLPYTWRNVLAVTRCSAAGLDVTTRPDAGRGSIPTFLGDGASATVLAPLSTVTLSIGVTRHLSTYQPADGGLLWDITVERIAEAEETGQQVGERSLAYGYYYGTSPYELWFGLDRGSIDKLSLDPWSWWWFALR